MIRKLIIDRLRGFDHFELHDLGRVNLLVGTNNSGKTTVLESIQMLSTPGDIFTIYRILRRRGEEWWETSERVRSLRHVDVRRLFRGHEIHRGSRFEIQGFTDLRLQKFSAEIVDLPDAAKSDQPPLFEPEPRQEDSEEQLSPSAISLSWDDQGESSGESSSAIIPLNRKGGFATDAMRRYSVGLEGGEMARLITSAALAPEAVVELFEAIVLTPDEELVIEALKIIDPSIERIATSGSERLRSGPESTRGGVLVRCKGINSRIPIGSMGDGIWRMLGLALALVQAGDGILLIDEIDTGLHFTVMANMWNLIYKTAKRLNVQVFATTHSRDCYESLAVICSEHVGKGSDITIQRIEKDRKVAVGYTEQEIIAAADRGMEVR